MIADKLRKGRKLDMKRAGWCVGAVLFVLMVVSVSAQELVENAEVAEQEVAGDGGVAISNILLGGGLLSVAIWLVLAVLSIAATWLIVDSFVNIREKKIIPQMQMSLISEALEEGNVDKAIQRCKDEPGVLGNILLAGFEKIADGPEAVEEAIAVKADLEGETLLQRVNYLSVVGNLSPMVGLLGTVQGMIMAFGTLGTEAGAAKSAMLAINISMALWTTAAGLVIAVPAIGFFSFFRNRTIKIILGIEAFTMEMVKDIGFSSQKEDAKEADE